VRNVQTEKTHVLLSWSDQLATGLPAMDAEHQCLIDLINQLGELHERRATANELRGALSELRNYSAYHFRTETQLMQRYPVHENNRRTHLAAHRSFIERLDSFDSLVAADPGAVIECLLAFTVKWLVHHVTGVDARLAREIADIESGVASGADEARTITSYNALIDSVSDIYDGMGARAFDLLHANLRLQQEIERRQRVEEELRLAAIVFDAVDEAVMVTDADNRIVRVNASFTRITGFSAEESIGANPRIMSGGAQPREFYQQMWNTLLSTGKWQGEIRNRRKNGELFLEWLSIYRMCDPASGVFRHVAVFSDITKQRLEADRIHYLANYDLLTGLPNRAMFMERVKLVFAAARQQHSQLALMFVDLDLFKGVNDALGHDVGDLLLNAAAMRMRECLREPDTVARFGGDEFVVLMPQIPAPSSALEMAGKLRETISQPFQLGEHAVRISCSIGIAFGPDADGNEAQLLKNADTAMYRAKLNGRAGVEAF